MLCSRIVGGTVKKNQKLVNTLLIYHVQLFESCKGGLYIVIYLIICVVFIPVISKSPELWSLCRAREHANWWRKLFNQRPWRAEWSMKNLECVLLSDGILFKNVTTLFVYELHVIGIKAIYSICEQLEYIVFNFKEPCDTLVIIA